ncbi:plexin-B1-like [Dreissena polymorpha]|uniref:plexin-B1-like n=1 Tax=Dreissena polymorpha TaxID=45954 RepID=UPI002263F2BD|nr:plexin-B1-like [Dreissena polymorpha]
MSNLEEKLSRFIESVDCRLGEINRKLESRHSAEVRTFDGVNVPPNAGHVGTSIPLYTPGAARLGQSDLQGDFQALRDTLSKVKLPAEVRLNDSRQGIKRADQPLMNVLSKCGRYCETGIQILCTLEAGTELDQKTLDNLFLIQHAQIKFLQEEFAALLVGGQFDASTAKIFRSLQKNTSGFDQDSLETLRAAATLSVAGHPSGGAPKDRYTNRRGFSGSGRRRYSHGQRGAFNGRSRDVFQSFTNRQFPRRQPREDSYAQTTETPCILKDTTTAYCKVPEAPGWIEQTINSSRGKRAAACVGCHEVEIVVKLDGVERSFNLKYYHDPALSTFNNGLQLFSVEQQYLTIEGNNLQLLAATDVNITIGIAECRIVEIQTNFMRCAAPREQPAPGIPGAEYPEVNVTIGNYQQSLGQLQYEKELNRIVLIAAASAGGATFLFVLAMLIICRKVRQVGSKAKKLKRDLNNLELEIKTVARQEFLDMQTSMSLVNRQLIEKGFPFKPYQSFACTALFGIEHLPPDTNIPDDVQWTGPLQSFEVLLGNKLFLASLIGTMEKQRSFFIREKSNLASNLCLIMMGRMDYLHEVIEDLLTNRVQETSGKRAMKTLFRRCDGITEKLLSNWLLLCLHPHLTGNIGCQLYLLYMATRKTIESGPIDDLTNDSKYTLTEEKLLTKFEGCEAAHGSQDVRFHAETLTLNVVVGNSEEIFPCNALDCDTITQVKVKCLEQIYVNYPASQMQVNPRDLILEWHSGFGGRMVLSDSDNTSIKEGEWVKLNTLAHYNVPDQSNMVLLDPLDHMVEQQEDYVNLARLMDTGSAMDIPLCVGDTGNELETEVDPSQVELKPWHLVKKEEEGKNKGRTIIAELYLNRLLTTKQSLMQYVGNVFGDVLDRNNCPPPAMFLFRFLDNIGDRMNADPNIVHAWKSHSYAIRVLAHLIQSPEMLFDVTKPSYVSDNLDVISQVFIDSFELAEHKFTANSASHKLVFFNEVRDYREKVKEFYANIRGTEFDNLALIKYMNEVNEIQEKTTFDKNAALYRLFMQIKPYSGEIMDDLSSNKITRSLQLHTKLAEILTKVDED